jgi:hypothetical protein
MAYASSGELTTRLGYPAPANAGSLLDLASNDVDRALQCAVYDVDGSGNPTDSAVIAALKAATLEQVAFQLEIGNADGIMHGLQPGVPSGGSAGGVELSRGLSTGGSSVDQPWLAPQAAWKLRTAGLLGWGPIPV